MQTQTTGGASRPSPMAERNDQLRERRIIRQAVLKAAATVIASRPELKSADLLALAEKLEAWVLR